MDFRHDKKVSVSNSVLDYLVYTMILVVVIFTMFFMLY
jgi:hypothetical protein